MIDVFGVNGEHPAGNMEPLDLERRGIARGPCGDCQNRQEASEARRESHRERFCLKSPKYVKVRSFSSGRPLTLLTSGRIVDLNPASLLQGQASGSGLRNGHS